MITTNNEFRVLDIGIEIFWFLSHYKGNLKCRFAIIQVKEENGLWTPNNN